MAKVNFVSVQSTIFKQVVATEYILKFVKQGIPHQRDTLPLQAGGNNGICRTRSQTGPKNYMGINDDSHGMR